VLPVQSVFKHVFNHCPNVFSRLQIMSCLLLLASVDFWVAEILKPSMCWTKCFVKCIPYNIYCYSASQRNYYVKPKKNVVLFNDAVSCYYIAPVEDEVLLRIFRAVVVTGGYRSVTFTTTKPKMTGLQSNHFGNVMKITRRYPFRGI